MEKKNQEILAPLQYKPLYNISRSEKWGKEIQATAYIGVCKGQLISKCLFGAIVSTKKPTKFF